MVEKNIQNRDFGKFLEYVVSEQETIIVILAKDKDATKNTINRISCKTGIPIMGYVYDAQQDNYIVNCADFLQLGSINFSCKVKVKSVDSWEFQIPLPEKIILKHLSEQQKFDIKNFKKHFPAKKYDYEFMQMTAAN